MTVEAIRAYAAANNGQLPQHLAEITAMPVPVNPRTGKPFDYIVDGNTGVLFWCAVCGISVRIHY
ncbi:MAG TPA: hypothetical protein VHX86_04315 [Tepidisphaeraceae bacterium]|jgi:hypothetical protein|nr:hypothetical protein [Tepidisphaeraceae bacterium]